MVKTLIKKYIAAIILISNHENLDYLNLVFKHVNNAKILLVVKTLIKKHIAAIILISNHESLEQQPYQSATINQKLK